MSVLSNTVKQKVYEKNRHCHYCNYVLTFADMTIDHFVPTSKGGSNSIENLFASCWECNSLKGDRIIESKKNLKAFRKTALERKRSK